MPSPDTSLFSSRAMGANMDAMLYQLTAYTTLATISDQNAPRSATFRSKCCDRAPTCFSYSGSDNSSIDACQSMMLVNRFTMRCATHFLNVKRFALASRDALHSFFWGVLRTLIV